MTFFSPPSSPPDGKSSGDGGDDSVSPRCVRCKVCFGPADETTSSVCGECTEKICKGCVAATPAAAAANTVSPRT